MFPACWSMSRMSVTYNDYSLLFKMMGPIKISRLACRCTYKCYLHQPSNFCVHVSYLLTEVNAYALFFALEYCDRTTEWIVEWRHGAIARQWHGKHISTAMNQHARIEELLEIMFSMLSVLRLHNEATSWVRISHSQWVVSRLAVRWQPASNDVSTEAEDTIGICCQSMPSEDNC
jgi:hypothetical protein